MTENIFTRLEKLEKVTKKNEDNRIAILEFKVASLERFIEHNLGYQVSKIRIDELKKR